MGVSRSIHSRLLAGLLLALAQAGCVAAGGRHANPPAVSGDLASLTYRVPVDGFPSLGDDKALVTMVEFADYECSYCAQAEATVSQLRLEFGDDLRVIVVQHPMSSHRHARAAALAALAADLQGRFDSMHERLYRSAVTDEAIEQAVRDEGLDPATYAVDRTTRAEAALARAEQVGRDLGVPGTPAFFINGRMLVGPYPYETFRRVVEERRGEARRLVAAGVRRKDLYWTIVGNGLAKVVEGC
jgi:protein-disulfide isomerase